MARRPGLAPLRHRGFRFLVGGQFFVLGAAALALAILIGLTQPAWRDFGASRSPAAAQPGDEPPIHALAGGPEQAVPAAADPGGRTS